MGERANMGNIHLNFFKQFYKIPLSFSDILKKEVSTPERLHSLKSKNTTTIIITTTTTTTSHREKTSPQNCVCVTTHTFKICLGGGFKYFNFLHLFGGKISILTNIFQMGWNRQLDVDLNSQHILGNGSGIGIPTWIPLKTYAIHVGKYTWNMDDMAMVCSKKRGHGHGKARLFPTNTHQNRWFTMDKLTFRFALSNTSTADCLLWITSLGSYWGATGAKLFGGGWSSWI